LNEGLLDPDGFFAERGFRLATYEADGEWWVDLIALTRRYGRGSSERKAKERAVRRWMSEQE
jgi:hypothetical protein